MNYSLRESSLVRNLRSIGLVTNRVKPTITKFDPALSGLRGLASFYVVLLHESNHGTWPFTLVPVSALTYSGFLGVPIFLMLSMYLLLNRLDANTNLKHYFKRRIMRIWPIYYGTLVVAYLLFPYPFWDSVRYLFFVEYYANPMGYFPVSVFWTLQLEEAIYLLIPLIHIIKPKKLFGLGIIFGGLGYLSYITFFSPLGQHPISYLQILLPTSLIGYGFGILAYTGVFRSLKLRWLGVAGILGFFVMNMYSSGQLYYSTTMQLFVNNVLLYSVALVGLAFVVARPPAFLAWFTALGEESYALYAIHLAFITLFGLTGLFYAFGAAFLIEFSVSPKEMARRLSRTYSKLLRRSGILPIPKAR